MGTALEWVEVLCAGVFWGGVHVYLQHGIEEPLQTH